MERIQGSKMMNENIAKIPEEDFIDWDFQFNTPAPKKIYLIKVKLKFIGKTKPKFEF